MSPKEKAVELVDKYREIVIYGYLKYAKKCSLIAVDEVIAALPIDDTLTSKFKLKWWGWVKEEI